MQKDRNSKDFSRIAMPIVTSIYDAVGDQIKEDLSIHNFATGDGNPGRTWDFINTNLCNRLNNLDCMSHVKRRGPWDMVITYEKTTGYIYTIMREKRYAQIHKDIRKRKHMHYLDILARNVNNDLLAPQRQLSFEPVTFQDEDQLSEKFQDLVQSFLDQDVEIKRYVLVLFESFNFELNSVRAVTIDSNLDIVKDKDWSSYIPVKESVVASYTTGHNNPANNPTRGLKLRRKAIARQKAVARKKEEKSNKNGNG